MTNTTSAEHMAQMRAKRAQALRARFTAKLREQRNLSRCGKVCKAHEQGDLCGWCDWDKDEEWEQRYGWKETDFGDRLDELILAGRLRKAVEYPTEGVLRLNRQLTPTVTDGAY